jgi:acyl-CoA thioesterase I
MNNTKIYAIVALVIVVVAGVWFFTKDKELAVRNYPSAGTDIIAFGDSLVYGTGASKAENNFVSLLSAKIGQPIVNLGIPGDTTATGLARVNELDKYRPKIVLLLLGGNDRLRRVPMQETKANLEQIIQSFQKRGAAVVLLGVRGNLLGDSFGGELEGLAKNNGTAYVPDVLDGLFGNREYMSDTIHPNDAGYAKIADRIYPVLLKLSR